MDNVTLLEKAAASLGRARAAYDLPLLKALQVDGLGRTLPVAGFTMMGNAGPSFINFDQTLSRDQYQGVVYLIISSILRKANDVPWGVFKPGANDERAELVKKGHPLNDLMWRPNPRESWSDLIESLGGYLLLRGNSYGFGVIPAAGSKAGQVEELYCMPADKTAPVETKDWLNPVDGYTMKQPDDSTKKYESSAVMHVKYWNPDSAVVGLSPLQAMTKMVTLADSGLNAQVRQQQNQGPAGVLYDESSEEAWTTDQSRKVQNWFRSFFPGGRQQGELPVVGGKLGYVKLGLSAADLDILEALQVTTRQLCSGFGFPAELLNDKEASTYNNVSEARKAALTDAVLPLLRRLRDGLNRFIGPGFKDEVFLDIITDGIPELQDDRKAQAEMLDKAWWISVQRKQAIMGEKVDEKLPKYLFPMSVQPLEDLAVLPPGADAAAGAGAEVN